ncbi:hypothetical protein MUG91_G109n15 [Manis pentadactyla]|nr:hypothetical protein MUG91_G109n15 [Manis pentadactyla]
MVTEPPDKIYVDSQRKLTLSQWYWKFSMFNSLTFYKKKRKSLSLWQVAPKLHEKPGEGFTAPAAGNQSWFREGQNGITKLPVVRRWEMKPHCLQPISTSPGKSLCDKGS